jgi:hypothetical protein
MGLLKLTGLGSAGVTVFPAASASTLTELLLMLQPIVSKRRECVSLFENDRIQKHTQVALLVRNFIAAHLSALAHGGPHRSPVAAAA